MLEDELIQVSLFSVHDERCEGGKKHSYVEGNIEACYWCEKLRLCTETYSTNDEEYPVICFDCKENY